MRAIWSGAITFSLVSIPVQLFPAVKSKELKFHWLHKPDKGRIQYVKYCALENKPVSSEEIARAFEYQKGHFVEITDAELAAADPKAAATIDIQDFVQQSQIDPIYFAKPYYIIPESGAEKAYRLLTETLAKTGHVAIANWVLKHRQHLVALRPKENWLILDVMHYQEELVKPEALPAFPQEVEISAEERELAEALTSKMHSAFQPEKYVNLYQEKIKHVIDQKIKGQEIVKPAPVKLAPVVDLVAALKQSLKEKAA